jgi:CDP-diacylglycerol--glycerol-3-phosphate 3-phosphatidyltransferase
MLTRLTSRSKLLPTCLRCARRLHFANGQPRHPAFDDLATSLVSLPEFRTRGADVHIIYEPSEFYKTLLVRLPAPVIGTRSEPFNVQRRISEAKRRIFIASLYIGKEEKELVSRSCYLVGLC